MNPTQEPADVKVRHEQYQTAEITTAAPEAQEANGTEVRGGEGGKEERKGHMK